MDALVLLVLILLSAIISAAEIGFFAVNETRLRAMDEAGSKRARMALHLRQNPQRLLSTIMIGDNLVNALVPSYTTLLIIRMFDAQAFGGFVEGLTQALAVALGALTFILMIFGDVVPKTLAAKYAVHVALNMAYPVYWIQQGLKPLLYVLEPIIDKVTGGKGLTVPFVTEEELKIMLDVGSKSGMIESHEARMINRVFQLNDLTAEHAMTPRQFVFALDANVRLAEVQEQLFRSKYSRIPLYDGNLDNIIGMIYKSKALTELAKGNSQLRLKDIAQPPLFVPTRKTADELMKQFQQEKRHMAIVVNEFGGFAGVVTLEDILEEVVGDILDETDQSEELIKRVAKNQLLVHGRTEVRRINEFLKLDLDEEANTISGLIQDHLGRIPAAGEEVVLNDCRLIVQEADQRSIKRVQIIKEEKPVPALDPANIQAS
ncbi:HlyC/CorC family transporter [Nitrospira tepida]|uniref:HlyC/CorC family transporter n=1 Tax=Nitrospira tepida TaxID=2973512 RepID=A0AA86T7V6_9BACT|nr:hemolysin family protein [Nitrospira tepida]CAI4031938.1 HlyC/CorC family transporter [Nitrospira tepida]